MAVSAFYIGCRSWAVSIVEQRKRLVKHMDENSGLKSKLPESIVDAYDFAKSGAEKETGIPSSTFPDVCPWTYEQFMNPEFWPEVEEHKGIGSA